MDTYLLRYAFILHFNSIYLQFEMLTVLLRMVVMICTYVVILFHTIKYIGNYDFAY